MASFVNNIHRFKYRDDWLDTSIRFPRHAYVNVNVYCYGGYIATGYPRWSRYMTNVMTISVTITSFSLSVTLDPACCNVMRFFFAQLRNAGSVKCFSIYLQVNFSS